MEEVRYIEEVRKKFGTKSSLLGNGSGENIEGVTRLVLSPVRKKEEQEKLFLQQLDEIISNESLDWFCLQLEKKEEQEKLFLQQLDEIISNESLDWFF